MPETLGYVYDFAFPDGKRTQLSLAVDPETLTLVNTESVDCPEWAALEAHRCPNCMLSPATEPFCPVALALVRTVEVFRDSLSYEEAEVRVTTPERTYINNTSLQVGLSSLVGLLMATSGCPSLEKLRPMARFHLPFATTEETTHRVMGSYLFAQYVRMTGGADPDWELKYLQSMYDSIREVNKHVVMRLRDIEGLKDASLTALVGLDCFAINIKLSVDLSAIEGIRKMYSAYM